MKLDDSFKLAPTAQRCIVVPFQVTDTSHVEIASAAEKFKVELDLEARAYALYFEVCEGDEIFYKITLVPSDSKAPAKYLLDDPWGGEKDKVLAEGLVRTRLPQRNG
ncbi:competence protein ComJ [Pseudomonas sp. B21-056]|uniref:competence protein ComJ n=1 Tax=Pseudomonas sp. B21-056 TaxID=2895495 RepID=UPI00222EF201|nr:hypothetical protein [Pseudomonas sp. B21-056]